GNRWPRQETLALIRIRTEMDANFRDSGLKAPLWEEVSRRLGELGFQRSAKKCKEKFENVHKYYKKTKGGKAGRQDGKCYRFFAQLEALYGSNSSGAGAITPVGKQQSDLQDEDFKEHFDPNSKRWPKQEVHALIRLRSGMESKFQEPGAKGPLWEEISTSMGHMGYSRSSKRCKEKWENINKYFRKTKDSSKRRSENSKTCPYFQQLDMLYRTGVL
ncbi:hypothetical protein SELMODRAFT_66294, partial [Selaginella moellendorffii]